MLQGVDRRAPDTWILSALSHSRGDVSPEALRVFAALREPGGGASGSARRARRLVRRTLRREALLAWKGRVEATRPELLLEREEIERKVDVLAELDREMRALNKRLLAESTSTAAHLGARPPGKTSHACVARASSACARSSIRARISA